MTGERILAAIVCGVVVAGAACSDDDGDTAGSGVERIGEQVERGDEEVAVVRVSEQRSGGDVVVVDEMAIDGVGWVVIYSDGGGAPGRQLGVSEQITGGSASDVVVTLDESLEEDAVVHAMVHTESNDNDTFDYPDADPPATTDDGIVEVAFQVEVSG